MKVEGTLGYVGPDDPPAHYYRLKTADGKHIFIGLTAEEWGGDMYDGIPEFPKDDVEVELEITVKKK